MSMIQSLPAAICMSCSTTITVFDGSYDENYRIVQPDGGIRWIRDRAFPVKDENGVIYRIAGVAEDITERKQLEERLPRA